jgi:hypothetical protein
MHLSAATASELSNITGVVVRTPSGGTVLQYDA